MTIVNKTNYTKDSVSNKVVFDGSRYVSDKGVITNDTVYTTNSTLITTNDQKLNTIFGGPVNYSKE